MRNAIFKQVYRGNGIYWYPPNMFGDETIATHRTIAQVKSAIDAKLAKEESEKPDHLKYWDTLTHEQRNHWRKQTAQSELSASELAFNAK